MKKSWQGERTRGGNIVGIGGQREDFRVSRKLVYRFQQGQRMRSGANRREREREESERERGENRKPTGAEFASDKATSDYFI